VWAACAAVAALVVIIQVVPSAQAKKVSDEDYIKIMKQVGPIWQSFNAANKAMKHADAAKEAEKLVPLFRDAGAYWEAKAIEDAMAFSKTALTGAETAAKSGSSMEAMMAAQKQMQGTCAGCHMAHREKNPDGTYRIVDKK
jgi:hypothetical protein